MCAIWDLYNDDQPLSRSLDTVVNDELTVVDNALESKTLKRIEGGYLFERHTERRWRR